MYYPCIVMLCIYTAQQYSEEFKHLFNKSKKLFSHLPKPKPEIWTNLDRELSTVSNEISISTASASKVTLRKKPLRSAYERVEIAASRYSTIDSDGCDFGELLSILKRIGGSATATSYSEGDVVPILDTTTSSKADLRTFLGLFTADVPESATTDELVRQLSKFIPVTVIQEPAGPKFDKKTCAGCGSKHRWYSKNFSTCYWCSGQFCKQCPIKQYQYPRIGMKSHSLCNRCTKELAQADADDWAEASLKFLTKTDDESIMASLGCASVAMALGANSCNLLKGMARDLHGKGLHELAFQLITLAISRSNDEENYKQEVKMHLLASSILKSLVQDDQKTWEDKWCFALASKEAYLKAASMITDSDTEVLDNRKKEIDGLVNQLFEEKKREHDSTTLLYTSNLESLWTQRNILGMLDYLKEINTECCSVVTVISEDASLKAFQQFLQNKEPYLSAMLPEDRQALIFLKGVLKLKEKTVESSLADIESVAWNSPHSNVSTEVLLGAYLHALSDQDSTLYSYKTLRRVLKSGSSELLFSPPRKISPQERSRNLLFPSDEELTPPFKANWPSFSVVGHNIRCHEKYEEAVMKLYDEKKWTYLRVAWAFLDEVPGCEHPAEMAVCYLHAAMWMAKRLTQKSKLNPDTLFGLKCVIMRLIGVAHAIALRILNPGFELYVIRLVFGLVRKIALMPNSRLVLTDEDASYLQTLSKRLVKVSRLFPFWEPPMVSVSEAVMFNIITRNLHSTFVLGLQIVNRVHRPLKDLDLKYQLYENDLRDMLPLENSSDTRAQAMEELLKSQGWSWNDVVQIMSSSLTPRDAQGWLTQSPYLGIPQQYYEITGFVADVDPDHPSLKLLVVEADPRKGRVGLFSQEDINTMLQLDLSDLPLYFSLDPPGHDLDKHYHPFQQWRYQTEKIKDTEVMKTMFITDYLMKSFTVGSEVSALPPFKQRPCKKGLTKNLPPKLQEAIRSIHERGGHHSNDTHRFWIEAKEMTYDIQQNESKIEYRFGDMEMIVKSHSLLRRTDGELTDTDEEDDPDSSHAKFAQDMTKNYRDLSHYFPVFARLRQLSKLHVFALLLQSLLQNLKETSEGKGIEIPKELVKKIQDDVKKQYYTNVSTALTQMKQEIGNWPKAQNRSLVQSKVDEIKSEMRSEISREEDRLRRIHGYNVIIDNSSALSMLRNVESKVIEAFQRNDEDTLSQVTEALQSSLNTRQDYQLKQLVRGWLSSDNSSRGFSKTPREKLTEYLCSHLPVPTYNEIFKSVVDRHRQKYQSFLNVVNGYKERKPLQQNSCKWVPAAISSETHSLSYGGVAFNTKLISATGLRPSRNETSITVKTRPIAATKAKFTSYPTPIGNSKPENSNPSDRGSGKQSWIKSDESSSSGSCRHPTTNKAAATADKLRQTDSATKNVRDITKRVSPQKPEAGTEIFKSKNSDVNIQVGKFCDITAASPGGKPPGGKPPPPGAKPPGRPPPGGKPPGGKPPRGKPPGGSSGGGPPEEPQNRGLMVSSKGPDRLLKYCRHPSEILGKPLPPFPTAALRGKVGSKEKINGLYLLRSKSTGKVYVGRSCDILRRIYEHQKDVTKGRKTVGKHMDSMDDMEFCMWELPTGLTNRDMQYYEQQLLNAVGGIGDRNVMNVRNAMKIEKFKEHTPTL